MDQPTTATNKPTKESAKPTGDSTAKNSSGSDTDDSQVGVNSRPRRQNNKMATPVKKEIPPTPQPMHVRIPPFWPEKPAIWFAQVEGQFAIMRVTDETAKFYHVSANLDRQYAAEVEDILTGPPDYQRLKDELIKRLSATRENQVKQLLSLEQLGTRKPSQFLRHLQRLAGPNIPGDFVRTIWSSRLPASMQPIVASQCTLPLDSLAELADRVHDIAAPTYQVASTATTASSSSSSAAPSSPIDELTRQVAELTRQVSALTVQSQHRSRSSERQGRSRRGRSSSRRSRTPAKRSESNYRKFPNCWYHHSFGSQADNCIQPCDYDKKKSSENDKGSR